MKCCGIWARRKQVMFFPGGGFEFGKSESDKVRRFIANKIAGFIGLSSTVFLNLALLFFRYVAKVWKGGWGRNRLTFPQLQSQYD